MGYPIFKFFSKDRKAAGKGRLITVRVTTQTIDRYRVALDGIPFHIERFVVVIRSPFLKNQLIITDIVCCCHISQLPKMSTKQINDYI